MVDFHIADPAPPNDIIRKSRFRHSTGQLAWLSHSGKGFALGGRQTEKPELFKHGVLTELSPDRFRNSGIDRQSEIVAAINGPITHLLLLKGEKVQ